MYLNDSNQLAHRVSFPFKQCYLHAYLQWSTTAYRHAVPNISQYNLQIYGQEREHYKSFVWFLFIWNKIESLTNQSRLFSTKMCIGAMLENSLCLQRVG